MAEYIEREVALKIARIQGNRATGDCFFDLAGYAACGGELEDA